MLPWSVPGGVQPWASRLVANIEDRVCEVVRMSANQQEERISNDERHERRERFKITARQIGADHHTDTLDRIVEELARAIPKAEA
jgi:hypothetical protein